MALNTIQAAAFFIMRDWGINVLTPGTSLTNQQKRGISDRDIESAALYLNGAMGEIWQEGPTALSEQTRGAILRPETALTLDVTQFSTTVANVTTFATWMVGCTIRIAADPADNELLSATKLRRPYLGTTGTGKAAQIWGDASQLDTDITHLIEPIYIPNLAGLSRANDRSEFLIRSGTAPIVTRGGINSTQPSALSQKGTGQPDVYFVDTRFDALVLTTGILPKFLRVTPMPTQAYAVEFTAKVKPPAITAVMIDNGDHVTDPGTVIPIEWIETVLMPIARQRATSDALFQNLDAKEEIYRQYRQALKIIGSQPPVIGGKTASYGC